MRLLLSSLLMLVCTNSTLAQSPTPVQQAASCLLAKQFINPPKSDFILIGDFIDSSSYPGKTAIYLTFYPHPSRSRGFAFTVFREVKDRQPVYDIQNNARFVVTSHGIDFPGPPLGGIWTQQHLIAGIQHASKAPVFTISIKDLRALDADTRCASYTDKQ